MRLLNVVVRIVVFEHIPDLVGLAALKRGVEPAILRLKAAAKGAVDDELVDRHPSVRARKVMLLREAVSAERTVEERVRRRAVGSLLRLTGGTAFVLVERRVLGLMAGAAVGRIHVDGRTGRGLLQMFVEAGMARRAGDVLMGGAGVGLGDVRVADRAVGEICSVRGGGIRSEGEHGGGERGKHMLRLHGGSPFLADGLFLPDLQIRKESCFLYLMK